MRPKPTENNAKRFQEILAILARHHVARGITPASLRSILEDLGPTFVKLGQIFSMRSDMLPAAYCEELSLLRADVKPMSFEEVRRVIETEYGRPLEEAFPRFDQAPLGSASIAQAHAAFLPDGRRVVVKVQRPGIYETMEQDVRLLKKASGVIKLTGIGEVVDLHMVLDEMWAVAQQEMDFTAEAEHLERFRALNADVAFVDCPRVEQKLTTKQLLVMEYVEGYSVDDAKSLERAGYELSEIGAKLADNYVKQIIVDGYFHADPHPGNIRIRGGKIVWIDMGMMGTLTPRDQALFRKAMSAVVEHDVAQLKTIVLTMGDYTARIDHPALYGDIEDFLTKYATLALGSMNLGAIIEELMALAKRHGIAMPKGMSMLGRGVLTIEGVIGALSPDTDFLQIMAARMSSETLSHIDWQHELRSGARQILESGRKSAGLIAQLSDLMRMGVKGQFKLNLEITGSEKPLSLVGRMVAKLVRCLLACAAFLGGSIMLSARQTTPAILAFIAALALGAWATVEGKRRR